MKYCFFISCLLFLNTLQAQMVLSESTFYQIGDSLPIAIDRIPEITNYQQSKGNWDFRILQAPYSSFIKIKPALEGLAAEQFPDAKMVAIHPNGKEEYFQIRQNRMLLLGTNEVDPLDMGITIATVYDSAIPIIQKGMKTGDQYQFNTTGSATFPVEILPNTTLNQLPVLPDSLRIVLSINQKVAVEGSGNLRLLNNSFDVLNIQKETQLNYKLEVKTGRLSWQDISALYSKQEQLHPPTIKSHHFYSNDKSGSLVDLYLDRNNEEDIDFVRFDAWEQNIQEKPAQSASSSVLVYPNPAIVDAIFEFSNFPVSNYTLAIYNLIGIEVWSQQLLLNGDKTVKFNVSRLNKGTYWYNIKDETGKILYTNRLFVVKP